MKAFISRTHQRSEGTLSSAQPLHPGVAFDLKSS